MQVAHQDDRGQLTQSELDISSKTRVSPLAWNGQFSPQLVESLIRAYGARSHRILDPFSGSGTVMAEALRQGKSSVGFEINPAAFLLSSVYELAALNESSRRDALNAGSSAVEALLVGEDAPVSVERVSGIRWPESLHARRVTAALLLLTFRSSKEASIAAFKQARSKLATQIVGLPRTEASAVARLADAREMPLENASCDLTITSPPYINVYNYHQQYRPIVEAIGCLPLKAASSEIGANRKHRQNRFLTVVQYCLDLTLALQELARVSAANSRAILILGRESNVLGTSFENGELATKLLRQVFGVDLLVRQERMFMNRFGQNIKEDILHFRPCLADGTQLLDVARNVGVQAMKDATSKAPKKSVENLDAAIAYGDKVQPSPLISETTVLPRSLRFPTQEAANA